MERGLRQEDLISPFLFLIVAEALHVMMIHACNKGIFKCLSLANDGTNISLLQYADDAIFMEVESIARSMYCSYDSFPFSYLVLRNRLFKIGGRSTLTKSVLGSLPLYFMGMFKAPESVISRLESIRRRFFSIKDGEKWFCWNKVLSSIKDGGLGIGSIKAKILALIARWRWHFLVEHNTLWRKVISEIHGSDGGFMVSYGSVSKLGLWGSIIKCCKGLGPLKFRFPYLYAIETHKSYRFINVNGDWISTWS
ncbi:RNA-directed DNA polymerase, eukaryota, reverse transcriptase zinc-binding domain protein [Tanacetum coccineum]|uniref:RNA-directed DNA polymerase, eukaryota, reverse transcriptase zinc-binding domain protein n=1 Tax=Tanacetum coccineum TaxID=301880 RepID=A0ABQ4ZWE3_9ASTR